MNYNHDNLRCLQFAAGFSEKGIRHCKREVIKFCKDRVKDTPYHRFINWEPESNEIAVYTLYTFADLSVPQRFDCIFRSDDPAQFVISDFTITQAVLDLRFPIEFLGSGHKHLCVLSFRNNIPEIMNLLPQEDNHSPVLSCCNYTDLKLIIQQHKGMNNE